MGNDFWGVFKVWPIPVILKSYLKELWLIPVHCSDDPIVNTESHSSRVEPFDKKQSISISTKSFAKMIFTIPVWAKTKEVIIFPNIF